ncbi:MAG TPA: alpha/beta fold hydrolase [Gaiellaceae bacterium]|jgi:pimeloyl-ACP methyl ester carboxylesterase
MTKRVVLLHSAVGDSRQWARQVAALRERFDVVAPDLPGFGTEPMPAQPYSPVDRVAPLLPASLVGNSFGGVIALRTALAKPGQVERLVLVGAALPDWEWSAEIRDYWAREAELFDGGDVAAAVDLNLEFWIAPEHRDELRPQLERAFELQSTHEEPELLWPELAPLETLSVPTLVVVGDRDKDDFRRIAERLAATIPGARLEVIEGAGHVVGVDRPDELNRLLLEFLQD